MSSLQQRNHGSLSNQEVNLHSPKNNHSIFLILIILHLIGPPLDLMQAHQPFLAPGSLLLHLFIHLLDFHSQHTIFLIFCRYCRKEFQFYP